MTLSWPRARPAAGDRAVVKAAAEDFRVVELPSFQPAGEGEHLYLRLEKTDLSTPDLARQLAQAFDVPPVAVGYAGMKDKRAVTEQWFSVQTSRGADRLPPLAGVRLLGSARHARKLRRGQLSGNRFRIRLRHVSGDAWSQRLAEIRQAGAPNYFGPQRFGGDNLAVARCWLPQRRRRRISNFHSGLYLSVLRSFLFNEVLAARVCAGNWNRLLPGDVLMSVPAVTEEVVNRQVPTGPLWGRGRSPASSEALTVETGALACHAALCEGLEYVGLAQERRSLVLHAADLQWQAGGSEVELEFALPPGAYATTLLAEAFELDR